MNTQTEKYETGATSHAVNDLILFTDNTRELAEYRDNIYRNRLPNKFPKGKRRVDFKLGDKCHFVNGGHYGWHMNIETKQDRLLYDFIQLLYEAQDRYKKEFPNYDNHAHITEDMTTAQLAEYCQLYANDFENWKAEHSN